jgi:outer membrane protein assembly factor BamB
MRAFGRIFAVGLLGTCLAACDWFTSGEPVRPVSPLPSIAVPVQGNVLWTRDLGGKASSGRLQPALQGDRIYVASGNGIVAGLDARSGGVAWQSDVDARITGGVGVGAGLVLTGTAEGRVIALDSGTGAERWRSELSSEILSSPAANRGVVVARTNDGKVIGLGAGDGQRLWSFEREVPVLSLRGSASPVIVGDEVICGLDGGKLVNLQLATGRPLWEIAVAYPTGRSDLDRVVDIDGEPLVAGEGIFVATYQGYLSAVSRTTGTVAWSIPFSSYSGLAASADTLFATDDLDHVWAIEPSTGKVRWTQKTLSGRRLSGPAAIGGWVAVGDLEGYVHWLDDATGEIRGRNRIGDSPITGSLVAGSGAVYGIGSEGEIGAVSPPEQ